MRRNFGRVSATILAFLFGMGANAQETATAATKHYSIEYPADLGEADAAFASFEAIRTAIDEVFRFSDGGALGNIVICRDKAAFDAYVSGILGETRNQYLFLKYADPGDSRLILYPVSGKTGYEAFASYNFV